MGTLCHPTAFVLSLLVCAPLAAEIRIGGKVTRGNGSPVAKARVVLLPQPDAYETATLRLDAATPEPAAETETDDRGLFTVVAPDIGFWNVRIEKPGFVPRLVELSPLLDPADLATLELEKGDDITVRALGADGEPIAARVRAERDFPERGSNPFGPRRRDPGIWSIADLVGATHPEHDIRWTLGGDDPWILEAHAAGYQRMRHRVSPGTNGLVELRLSSGTDRPVEVTDDRGRPIVGAVIRLEKDLLPMTQTDDRGQAVLNVDPGELSLVVRGPDSLYGTMRLVALDPTRDSDEKIATETITLREPVTVSGRVIDDSTREPISGALVWIGSGIVSRSDGAGSYTITGPREAFFGVSAMARHYTRGLGRLGDLRSVGLTGEETTVEGPTVALMPAASLRGLVVDQDGEPIAGVEITNEQQRSRLRRGFSFVRMSAEAKSGRTSDQGRFEISGLALVSGYVLRFSKDGLAPAKLEIAELASFEERDAIRIVMSPGRRGVGWVVDENNEPVAGAEVYLTEAVTTQRRPFPVPGHTDKAPDSFSASDGRFEVPDLAPGRFDLRIEAAGFAAVEVPGIEIPEGRDDFDLGMVVVLPGAAIEGRVVDDHGQPIEGAEIRISPAGRGSFAFFRRMTGNETADAVSMADGRFELADQQPGARVDLSIEKTGFVAANAAGIEAPNTEPLEIVLRPASKILGRVVDGDGQPISGATVEAYPHREGGSGSRRGMTGWRRENTGEDGAFEILDVEPGPSTVSATASGFRTLELAGIEVPPDEPVRDLKLVLLPGAEVRGTVTDADGSPAVGVFVGVTDIDSRALGRDGTITDADGNYVVAGTATGRRKVLAMDRSSRRTSKIVEIEMGENTVDLVFEDGIEVSGRVVDDTGAPVAAAQLWLRPDRSTGVRRLGRFEAVSGGDGSFTIPNVQPGTYELEASQEGYAPSKHEGPIEVADNPIAGLIVRLSSGATLTGRVLGLEYDDLARVEIRAMISGRAFARPDFEGRYRLPNLPSGEVTVQAEIPGSGRQVREKTTIPEGAPETVLDLEFGSGFTLTGTVFHGERPVGGASLTLNGVDVSHFGDTTVSQDGSFRVEGLPAGTYRVSVSDWNSGLQHGEEIEIIADTDVQIEIETARIAGRVRDAIDFSPIEGATVTASRVEGSGESARGPRPSVARSDARGYFSLGGVGEGTWKIAAVKSGYGQAEETVDVRAGSAIEDLDLAMSATRGLTFPIALESGRIPTSVSAVFLDGNDRKVAGGTYEVSDGEVTITTVPDGAWEMLFAAEDSAQMSLPVTVPGELGQIVAPPGGGLSITITDLEEGGGGATIRLLDPAGRPHRTISFRGEVQTELTLRGGSARARNLKAGVWRVDVVYGDGRSRSASATVVPGAEVEISVP